MKRRVTGKTLIVAPALLAVAFAQLASAQDRTRSAVLEGIIVTAQKREENLQDAPISIAAMSQDQLEARGITNLADFGSGSIPSLRIQPFVKSPSTLTISRAQGLTSPTPSTTILPGASSWPSPLNMRDHWASITSLNP